MLKKRINWHLFALFSGILLSLPWLFPLGPVLFFAFIPLLLVENYIYENRDIYRSIQVFFYSFEAFFVWNLLTTWWIWNSTEFGAIMAIVFNTLFMAVVLWLVHICHRVFGRNYGNISLVVFFVAFEYLHLNWDLSWAWLTLGNGFARNVQLVQWYEYTGVLGGSLWVLIVNVLFLNVVKQYLSQLQFRLRQFLFPLTVVLLPVVISLYLFYSYEEKGKEAEVVVVQPNIDPYGEKFGGMSTWDQLGRILTLADSIADDKTDYLVGPETAIAQGVWEESLEESPYIQAIRDFDRSYPHLKTVIGISSFRQYDEGEPHPVTARKMKGAEVYYDSYNTAIQLEDNLPAKVYHKSKLVLGVEKMPFPSVLGFLDDLIINLGGTTGTLGIQEERSVFNSKDGQFKIAPVICYESVYGEYFSEYARNGANLIFVITNDGWWGNTPGYRQHLSYSSLRAIETRRSIARSANTGVSCFIDQRGCILQPTEYWVPDVIKASIKTNDRLTFYVRFGDYIGRIMSFLAVFILFYLIVAALRGKKRNAA